MTRITEVCRSFWPVSPDQPDRRVVLMRKQFADLWPYDDFAMPWDWFWGVSESG